MLTQLRQLWRRYYLLWRLRRARQRFLEARRRRLVRVLATERVDGGRWVQ